jgi:hypothetical protein
VHVDAQNGNLPATRPYQSRRPDYELRAPMTPAPLSRLGGDDSAAAPATTIGGRRADAHIRNRNREFVRHSTACTSKAPNSRPS